MTGEKRHLVDQEHSGLGEETLGGPGTQWPGRRDTWWTRNTVAGEKRHLVGVDDVQKSQ